MSMGSERIFSVFAGRRLRTWQRIFREKGYIPTCLDRRWAGGKRYWGDFSDTGGYVHLLSAAALYLQWAHGKTDWDELAWTPRGADEQATVRRWGTRARYGAWVKIVQSGSSMTRMVPFSPCTEPEPSATEIHP